MIYCFYLNARWCQSSYLLHGAIVTITWDSAGSMIRSVPAHCRYSILLKFYPYPKCQQIIISLFEPSLDKSESLQCSPFPTVFHYLPLSFPPGGLFFCMGCGCEGWVWFHLATRRMLPSKFKGKTDTWFDLASTAQSLTGTIPTCWVLLITWKSHIIFNWRSFIISLIDHI